MESGGGRMGDALLYATRPIPWGPAAARSLVAYATSTWRRAAHTGAAFGIACGRPWVLILLLNAFAIRGYARAPSPPSWPMTGRRFRWECWRAALPPTWGRRSSRIRFKIPRVLAIGSGICILYWRWEGANGIRNLLISDSPFRFSARAVQPMRFRLS